MPFHIKTDEEIETLARGGAKLARILRELSEMITPGTTMREVDERAFELAGEDGDRPAFLHYRPGGAERGFPGSVCISVNDAIVHGIPNEREYAFRDGDVVKLDFGLVHDGLVTDSATTVAVGTVSADVRHLMRVTQNALDAGVAAARAGNRIGDIGAAVQASVTETGCELAKGLAGHGVGYEVHEGPLIPNENTAGTGEELVPGAVIAIEPMCVLGDGAITVDTDGFTIRSRDGSLSAHYEHTLAVTSDGPRILTQEA